MPLSITHGVYPEQGDCSMFITCTQHGTSHLKAIVLVSSRQYNCWLLYCKQGCKAPWTTPFMQAYQRNVTFEIFFVGSVGWATVEAQEPFRLYLSWNCLAYFCCRKVHLGNVNLAVQIPVSFSGGAKMLLLFLFVLFLFLILHGSSVYGGLILNLASYIHISRNICF